MKISLIGMNMRAGDTEYNFTHAEELLRKAAAFSDVIVLPETWNTGFFPKENIDAFADKDGKRAKELFYRISKEHGVCIVGGSVTEEKAGKIYNTCYIYDKKGECVSSYSKAHLFSHMGEDLFYSAGDGIQIFSIGDIKAAVIICYDIRFPEFTRKAALMGAELLFVPCQWPAERIEILQILGKGRAAENQMYALVCNSAGAMNGTVFGGKSFAASPTGEIIGKASESEEILTVDIDIEKVRKLRESFNVFADRREELYK